MGCNVDDYLAIVLGDRVVWRFVKILCEVRCLKNWNF